VDKREDELMKKTILAMMLIASFAHAEQVTVTGYGQSYERALENAKVQALEKIAGTFIIGENQARNGRVTEEIAQYNGGVIKHYDVISHGTNGKEHQVIITADVIEKKDNRVIRNNTDFSADFNEFEERARVVNRLDNVNVAIGATVINPRYTVGRYSTNATGTVILAYQPKWISDLKEFAKVVNQEGKVSNNAYNSGHGSVVGALLRVNPFSAVAVQYAGQQQPMQPSKEMMVCFDGSNDCHTIGVNFQHIPRVPNLLVVGSGSGRDYILYRRELDMKMYELLSAGDSRSETIFTNFKTTYQQPTLLVHSQRRYSVDFNFEINNSIATQLENIKVYLQ
jgi:hypothetical protein